MLARIERHGDGLRHLQREHVLGVVRRSRRITVAPARIDLVDVRYSPVDETAVRGGVDSGLLAGARGVAVSSSVSPGSWLPVTDCQKPGASARSINSTRRSGVWTSASVETGILNAEHKSQDTNTQNGLCRSRQ